MFMSIPVVASPTAASPVGKYSNCCAGGPAPTGANVHNPVVYAYKLCGALCTGLRKNPPTLNVLLSFAPSSTRSLALIALVTAKLPPLHTNSG